MCAQKGRTGKNDANYVVKMVCERESQKNNTEAEGVNEGDFVE